MVEQMIKITMRRVRGWDVERVLRGHSNCGGTVGCSLYNSLLELLNGLDRG